MFHAAYFDIWMEERLHSHRRGCLVAVDFYWLEHHVQFYSDAASSELAAAVADSLWGIEPRPKLFRLTSNCFVFWSEDEQQADTLLQRCQERLRRPIRVKGYLVHCPAVLVKILLEGGAADVEKLRSYIAFNTKQADCQGETYVVENGKALREQFEYQTEVERFLWDAVQQDRFEVWYQPIYSREEDRFVALEALSRLKHPKLGWIPPELFIRLAERNGLLFQIMPRQFEKICSFLCKHPDLVRTLQSVKVNLSPQELAEVGYCDKLLDMIRQYNLPFSLFQFEVTESTITQYSSELKACVRKLRQAGIHLCLDDFGSGYANLNAVMGLPFSVIKLDRSLLTGICEDHAAGSFYQGLVEFLQGLGYHIIAEGVETEREVELLVEWGVDLIQGYYFSKPLPPEQTVALLKDYGKQEICKKYLC